MPSARPGMTTEAINRSSPRRWSSRRSPSCNTWGCGVPRRSPRDALLADGADGSRPSARFLTAPICFDGSAPRSDVEMAGKIAEMTRDHAAYAACEMVVFEQYQIGIAVLDLVMNIGPQTRPGGLENVVFRNDRPLRPAKHFIQQVEPKGVSRLGAEHVVGNAQRCYMTESGRLFRIERSFFGENASIFAKGVERPVALDVEVEIKPAADIRGRDAEEIDPLDVVGIVVVERKKVRQFPVQEIPAGGVVIETVVPIGMQADGLLAQWLAPGRRLHRRCGLMNDPGDGHDD